jgi:tryptophan synthase alpha subunit
VGSAVIRKIAEAKDKDEAVANTAKFISEIKNALRD